MWNNFWFWKYSILLRWGRKKMIGGLGYCIATTFCYRELMKNQFNSHVSSIYYVQRLTLPVGSLSVASTGWNLTHDFITHPFYVILPAASPKDRNRYNLFSPWLCFLSMLNCLWNYFFKFHNSMSWMQWKSWLKETNCIKFFNQ